MKKIIRIVKSVILSLVFALSFAYIVYYNLVVRFSLTTTIFFMLIPAFSFLLLLDNIYPIDLKERAPSFTRILLKVSATLFFALIIIFISFIVLYKKDKAHNVKIDYVIVFGCGISQNSKNTINMRIEKALEYSKINKDCKFVLTGAKGSDEPIAEAFYMLNYMQKRGFDEKRILIDTLSVNTYENITNSLKIIEDDILKRSVIEKFNLKPFKRRGKTFDLNFLNIGMISSDFHMTRIILMSKKLGIKKPYSIESKSDIRYIPYMYMSEILSLIKAIVLRQV